MIMRRKGLLAGVLAGALVAVLACAAAGAAWLNRLSAPQEAPEAEAVLAAQIDLPFQVLVPAYLPGIIDRARVQIDAAQPGPDGEPMIRLVYPLRPALGVRVPRGAVLELREWLPKDQPAGYAPEAAVSPMQPQVVRCRCRTLASGQCAPGEVVLSAGPLRVSITVSAENILSMEQIQTIYTTLGPAANRQQVYSSMQDVPVTFSVPEAEEIQRNAEGIQEVTLVATPNGYNPVHFAVRKGIPVRLVFRQVGYVSCGNELIFQYGEKQSKTLTLATQDDQQVFEFTPAETGDFSFHCPHFIYRGVITVRE